MENIDCSSCGISFVPSNKKIKRCDSCRTKYFCTHNKQKNYCVECGGSQICKHYKVKSQCIECGGSQMCKHNKRKSRCVECGGSEICKHNKQKSKCVECGGSEICKHKKVKSHCIECGGGSMCIHKKQRSHCIECTPKNACQNCFQVYVEPKSRFKPYCFHCYCVLNPDAEIPRKFKLKEHHLRDFLKQSYPDINMIFDKALESKRRPDVLIKNIHYNIIIECDENQHSNYECEDLRICQIFNDLNNLPIFVIRFNPDRYSTDEEKFQSCFKTTPTGQLSLNKNEWNRRTILLKEKIDTIINIKTVVKEMNIIHMFYSE
jgi:hypothetical protein